MIELIYTVCALVALPFVDNAVDYDFYMNGEYELTVGEGDPYVEEGYVVEVCRPYYYTDIVYQYLAYNEAGSSELSPALTVQWVWNFDYDDNGIVGFPDYNLFALDFNTPSSRSDADENGIVGFSDFFLFAQRFGECNSFVKVVPCV